VDEIPVPQQIRSVVITAIEEAQRRGSATVSPEHLLLALVHEADSPAARILSDAGLGYDALDVALDTERTRSLAVVGIRDLDPALLTATPRPGRPSWASTTREVFRRAQLPGRGRRRRAAELDVLYGVVTANVGTVPRALEYAGVDRDALIGRVERERLADLEDAPRPVHQGGSSQERQALRREAVRRAQQERRGR
jgi:ATP-dependent Clp protease ATP-binding subunit ClpA